MTDKIIQFIGYFFFGLALWLIVREVEKVGLVQLESLILSTPPHIVLLIFGVTVLNYIVLSGYDVLALKYLHKKIAYYRILEASSVSFAVSNTAGHVYLSGGAIRYLFYMPDGLTKTEVLKMIAFETVNFFLGLALVFLLSVLLLPMVGIIPTHLYGMWLYISAGITILLLTAYYFGPVRHHKSIKLSGVDFCLPDTKMTLKQAIVGILDNLIFFCVFYVALRYHVQVDVLWAFSAFIIAMVIGNVSQVPGGLGVFEGTFLYLYPTVSNDKSGILAGLIVFRVLYYFLPFLIAGVYMGLRFIHLRRRLRV